MLACIVHRFSCTHSFNTYHISLQTSAVGCQETASSSTQTKLSYCGLDLDTVFTSTTFVCHNYILVMTVACDHVRLLGATMLSDFNLDRHVSNVSASGFYWLRQLQCCRRSFCTQLAATVRHSSTFVSSHFDYSTVMLF